MKTNKLYIGSVLAGLLAAAAVASNCAQSFANDEAFADSAQSGQRHEWRHHRGHRGGFFRGVCVGQALAAQGITLPKPTPGEKPAAWDNATQAAFKAAVESCSPAKPAPSPSPAPASS